MAVKDAVQEEEDEEKEEGEDGGDDREEIERKIHALQRIVPGCGYVFAVFSLILVVIRVPLFLQIIIML